MLTLHTSTLLVFVLCTFVSFRLIGNILSKAFYLGFIVAGELAIKNLHSSTLSFFFFSVELVCFIIAASYFLPVDQYFNNLLLSNPEVLISSFSRAAKL